MIGGGFALSIALIGGGTWWSGQQAAPRSADGAQAWRVEGALTPEPVAQQAQPRAARQPAAPPRDWTLPLSSLDRSQRAVAAWLAQRYDKTPEAIARLVREAFVAAGPHGSIDPMLVLAIAGIESGFDRRAQSPVGAQGLMQVMTRVHRDKFARFGGSQAAFDPIANLRVGVQVLAECIERGGSLEQGLKHYVGAANLGHDGGYAAKVLAERAHLVKVAEGRRVATDAPLPRPAAVAPRSVAQAPSPAPEASTGREPEPEDPVRAVEAALEAALPTS